MTTALCAAIGLPALGAGEAFAADSVGAVTKLRGQARIVRGGGNVLLAEGKAEGTKIESGDGIVTGPEARLKIQFKDGSVITLGENSKLNIDKAKFEGSKRDIAATLLDGIVRAAVAKAGEGSNFQVSSSLVTSAARGTEWIVSIKDHTTSLLVLEGTVNAKGVGETLEELPDAPVSKGVNLGVKQGLAVGEPARAIGMDAKDMGHPINWKDERINKLTAATDF
jgi:ferric-dicitrate binding protein FerR (iron transport regulator)